MVLALANSIVSIGEHDKFGSLLHAKGVTVDKDLELKNFEYAGCALVEIWSGLVIDGNSVVAEFIEDDAPVIVGDEVRRVESKSRLAMAYFLEIVKCRDLKCCWSFQSSYLKVVPKRFLPPPLLVAHTRKGIEWAKDEKDATYLFLYQNIFFQNSLIPAQATKKFPKGIPYNYCCSSVDQDMIKRQSCSHCGLYLSPLKAKSLHGSSCRATEGRIENRAERVRPQRDNYLLFHILWCQKSISQNYTTELL